MNDDMVTIKEHSGKGVDAIKAVFRIRIRSDPVILGHPDPDQNPVKTRILSPQKVPVIQFFPSYNNV